MTNHWGRPRRLVASLVLVAIMSTSLTACGFIGGYSCESFSATVAAGGGNGSSGGKSTSKTGKTTTKKTDKNTNVKPGTKSTKKSGRGSDSDDCDDD